MRAAAIVLSFASALPALATTPAHADDLEPKRAVDPGAGVTTEAPPPARDWAVFDVGVRPRLATFGGIATLSLAQGRVHHFYGVVSFATVREDAGVHAGVAELALGQANAESVYGALQLGLTTSRANTFLGLAQLSLARDDAGTFGGALQIAPYATADDFDGGAQIAGFADAQSFTGVVQAGLDASAAHDFTGGLQLGLFVSSAGGELLSRDEGGHFTGLAQVALIDWVCGDFTGLAQIGGASVTTGRFLGLAQIGAVSAAGKAVRAPLQAATLAAYATSFHGLAQVAGYTRAEEVLGGQIGLVNQTTEHHVGVQIGLLDRGRQVDGAQLGAIDWSDDLDGVQLGAINVVGRARGVQAGIVNVASAVRGVQIGLVNHATRLRGLQIGLVNHAEDGSLVPWSTILNIGLASEQTETPLAVETADR